MIAYIKGILDTKTNESIIIDVQGIGYKIFMPAKLIDTIGEIGNIVKVYTYYYVREDNISLYGFITKEELKMFELLISVSGVGAKSAIAMLSEIDASKMALAVISEDYSELVKIQGIGKKTAARIILELKDKLKTEMAMEKNTKEYMANEQNYDVNEATAALQVLGYAKKEIEKAFEKIDVKNLEIEELIKQALKYLSKN